MAIALISFLVVVIFVVFIVLGSARSEAERKARIHLADLLNVRYDDDSHTLISPHGGLRQHFTTRSVGSYSEKWTEISAPLPAGCPITLFLRPHKNADSGAISRGHMIDLQLGNAEFDRRFLVQGAPAHIVTRWLSSNVQSSLQAFPNTELLAENGTLTLSVREWLEDAESSQKAQGLVRSLLATLPEIFAGVVEATPLEASNDPYRPMVNDEARRKAIQDLQIEVAHVEQLRAQQKARNETTIFVGQIAFFAILFLAIMMQCR